MMDAMEGSHSSRMRDGRWRLELPKIYKELSGRVTTNLPTTSQQKILWISHADRKQATTARTCLSGARKINRDAAVQILRTYTIKIVI